jgi:hypothetical protein
MIHDPTRLPVSPFQAQAELELLQLILEESICYPWDPTEPEAEAYFDALEQEVLLAGWTNEELSEQGKALSTHLDQAWSTVLTSPQVQAAEDIAVSSVCDKLLKQFAAQVPQQLLEGIVQRARQAIETNLGLADKLVQCVQDSLPNWAEEDLQVLARPFAYAMRGAETEMLEAALRSVRCAAWTELSGIEQARLSLAIARYAIAQMPAGASENI